MPQVNHCQNSVAVTPLYCHGHCHGTATTLPPNSPENIGDCHALPARCHGQPPYCHLQGLYRGGSNGSKAWNDPWRNSPQPPGRAEAIARAATVINARPLPTRRPRP